MTTKPAHTIRSGAVGVSIWERDGKHGPFYEFTLSRSYLAKEGQSGYSGSFRIKDLPAVKDLVDRTGQWIAEQHVVALDGREGGSPDSPREPATATDSGEQ